MCNGKIKINLIEKEAEITILHTNEFLEFILGQNTKIPSINKEFKQREDVMAFANKLLSLNPYINLPTFKEVIFRMIAIKKYKFSIS